MLKITSYIIIIVVVSILILSEYPFMIYQQKMTLGDLYKLCYILKYKEKEIKNFSNLRSDKSPQILCIGDSFFASSFGHRNYSNLLEKSSSLGVISNLSIHSYDIQKMKKLLIKNPKIKLVIIESVERYLYGRFPNPLKLSLFKLDSFFRKRESKLEYLFKTPVLSELLLPMINSFKYKAFKDFPKSYLYFSEKTQKLYLQSTLSKSFLGSSFSQRNDVAIDLFVNNMIHIKKLLEAKNITLLIMIIPNKSTTELLGLNSVKKNHIVEIQKRLQAKKILYLDIFSAFKNKKDLYFKSDTHWNKKGVNIAIEETNKKLKLLKFSEK
ncbi:MAG: hypothetical protein COB02_02045 [Candidatus Cloacimonadota bacterium]|nr:MAG: hypothetical protein COB02_02045 [Candidatus Cloacimonadota bacterium]